MGSHSRHRPATVVVVDDYPGVRELLTVVLESEADFRVVGLAADGAEAVARAAAAQPDLVILDLVLPDTSGLAVLVRLRAAAPDTRVVVLSGSTEQHVADRVRAAGADAFVGKDVPVSELLAVLRAVVTRELHPT